MGPFFTALMMTMVAGLSTMIGWLVTILPVSAMREERRKSFLSFALGLSAGVMVYISFMELLPSAREALGTFSWGYSSAKFSEWMLLLAFFGGIGLSALIDRMVPSEENPHELSENRKLKKVGIVTALAVTVHNFPEGIATFMTAYQNPEFALAITFAIAIHNIPEGIAVSMPVYQATGSKRKSFTYTLVSGLAEPLGAVMAFFLLMPFLSDVLMGCIYAVVSGIMVFISFDELLPAAREYGKHHISVLGLVVGMAVMGVSLIYL